MNFSNLSYPVCNFNRTLVKEVYAYKSAVLRSESIHMAGYEQGSRGARQERELARLQAPAQDTPTYQTGREGRGIVLEDGGILRGASRGSHKSNK